VTSFVDSNVLIDIFSRDPRWSIWSRDRLLAAEEPLLINGIVYAEVSIGFEDRERLDHVLEEAGIVLLDVPRTALFAAGKAFRAYRRGSAGRAAILPNFLIGAHASELRATLITRDPARFRTYFPELKLITPEAT
jgi:predicted nucleic acid-binding protein